MDGKELRRPDGRGVEFSADGIALSDDGQWLYWQAIKGDTLYRIATASLTGKGMRGEDVGADVEEFGTNGVSDGLLIPRATNKMLLSAVEENAVKIRDLDAGPGGRPEVLVQDERLRWPDTFAQGPDGTVYVTTSHIQDSAFFKPDAPPALPTRLWKLAGGDF